jgi:hypothetical protein
LVAEFLRLVRAWIWVDRMRREALDPKAAVLPAHVERLLAPYRVEGAGGESPEQWAERAVQAESEERAAARAVAVAGRGLAPRLEAFGYDSRPILRVVLAADGGGGVAALASIWPAARVEIERIELRLRIGADALGTPTTSTTARRSGPATEDLELHLARALRDGRLATDPPSNATPHDPKLRPCDKRSLAQYDRALEIQPDLVTQGAGMKAVYDVVKKRVHDATEDGRLPAFATWRRYVNRARHDPAAPKRSSRGGRDGRSVVRREEL